MEAHYSLIILQVYYTRWPLGEQGLIAHNANHSLHFCVCVLFLYKGETLGLCVCVLLTSRLLLLICLPDTLAFHCLPLELPGN